MRFLIVETDYHPFLDWLYSQHRGLKSARYETQMEVRTASCFGDGAYFASNLRKLGLEAQIVYANNEHLQSAWAREHGLTIKKQWKFSRRRGFVPWLSRANHERWLYEILSAQIRHYQPDVLLNNAMSLSPAYFREIKPLLRMLIGRHGAPLPAERDFSAYDLVLSVVDNFVNYFRKEGLRSDLLRLAFEPAVLERLNGAIERRGPVTFVGQLSNPHASRQQWLEYLCSRLPIEVWAPSINELSRSSPVIRRHRGVRWGIEMFKTLHESAMTLNHHIDVAGGYAGNARLFEATGVGTLLVTDWKKNLPELFDPNGEVASYRTPEECAEIITFYLEHDEERQAIARAGQQRTLRDHTYAKRMPEFIDLIRKYSS